MSKESHIDGIRLYSDNLEETSKSTNTTKKVEYKKVEKITTTKTVVKNGNQTSQKTETTTKIKKDFGVPRQSRQFTFGEIKESLSTTNGQKDKYSYAGKLKEKQNYLYYVSGIGFVDKEGKPVKQDNKPKETKVIKNKPKPMRQVGQRVTITIQNKRPERKGDELVENFEYHETKDFGKHNRESVVIHKRLGDPFFQSIYGKKRSSTYTQGSRRYSNISAEKEESETVSELSKIKTNTVTTTKTTEIKTNYQNKTYNTTKSTQNNAQSGSNKYQRNTEINKSRTSASETKKYEPKKYEPKKYEPKKYEPKKPEPKKYEPKKYEPKKYEPKKPEPKKYEPPTKKPETKKYIPSTKKYQEKSEESYSRKTQNQYNPNLNKKVFDTEKYTRKEDTSKYTQKTEESYKSPMTDSKKDQEDNNMINDPNYCPIHGYHGPGQESLEQYKQITEMQGEGNFVDNYKFHESRVFSSKTHNINTNININTQNTINTEENYNTVNYNNMNEINMGNMGAQEQMIQGEEGYDLSKLYIATKVVPVYSDIVGGQYQCGHVCHVCGNPFDDNQINMMQENQVNSQQVIAYDSNCPIHGQNVIQQQINEY